MTSDAAAAVERSAVFWEPTVWYRLQQLIFANQKRPA
ncbi:hypothetical protein FB008_101649 [Sinorhizobium medicae]|nr:hypothetical protein FB008_101649 [Sinorhizobium medicae]